MFPDLCYFKIKEDDISFNFSFDQIKYDFKPYIYI